VGIYKTLWNHISLSDVLKIALAVFLASFFAYVALRIQNGYWQNPVLAVTTFYLFLTLSAGVRLLPAFWRMARHTSLRRDIAGMGAPALVIGAGYAADALIKDIDSEDTQSGYRIVGILDDDVRKHGRTLRGKPIWGGTDMLAETVKKHRAEEVIIAIPSASTQERQRLIAIALPTGCRVRFMSGVADLTQPTVADLHELDIGDLLGRREVMLNPDHMATYITDSVVLVTGGGGSIGSELCRQIMRFDPKELIIYDNYENNASDIANELRIIYRGMADKVHVRVGSVQDENRLDAVFGEFSPQIVFHAAAYKHVNLMEECPALAIENNVFGSNNVAAAALRHRARRFVLISTDKAVNPTNVMGASKRIAELVVQSYNGRGTEFVAVRFGNVLGSNGSVVPIFRRQIETGGPVTITHPDIIRYFMTIPEAARLVLQAGAMAYGGETFILDMGEPVKIVELARTMIEMAGLIPEEDIQIVFTGLRPGEKLYEELLTSAEGVRKTSQDKIFVAHSTIITADEREGLLSELTDVIARGGDVPGCIRAILPSYHADNGQTPPGPY
jgi:FlaA1/EpsC-like NDP-sugar epimerase